jgi:hypothetical protein
MPPTPENGQRQSCGFAYFRVFRWDGLSVEIASVDVVVDVVGGVSDSSWIHGSSLLTVDLMMASSQ